MRVLRDLSCCCGSHWHGWFEEIFVFALKSNWLRSSVFQQVAFMWITACSYILLIKTLSVGKMPKSLWSFLEWWTIHTPIWAISEIATKSPNSFSLKNFLAYVYISMSIEKWLLLAPPTLFYIKALWNKGHRALFSVFREATPSVSSGRWIGSIIINFNENWGMVVQWISWKSVGIGSYGYFFNTHIERKLQFIILDHKIVFRITDKNIRLSSYI